MRETNRAQWVLIFSGLLVSGLLAIFFARELFPEYRIYQDDFIALEAFHASLSHESSASFRPGIKQIVLEREDKGPPTVDRCISCHVALDIPYYSPTQVLFGEDKKPVLDAQGVPIQIENKDYIWKTLDQQIAHLQNTNPQEADRLEKLKTAHVGDHVYDLRKVLSAHPLLGKETRPFEFHPVEEYGCTSCHQGNGRALTADKAHGPVFDGTYEEADEGPVPHFLEKDPLHDPRFASIFNAKPGHPLLFQTEPLFVGGLMQAKCVQCHTTQETKENTPVLALLPNYLQGKELFVSQACYACHKIAGLSKGGVGPELTRAGDSYPWFLKQSIVWPQADLKTSTMPNFRLDHLEVEDLMAFLLAQKGPSQAIAKTEYLKNVREFELAPPLKISQEKIEDLSFSSQIFATEGCASCHRVAGLETQVGFVADPQEKGSDWFRTLFPETVALGAFDEEMAGSQILSKIQAHRAEIDAKIRTSLHSPGYLDQIDPQLLSAFYPGFRYALRAVADDPLQKERTENILKLYAHIYGLGRLIGPRLNWSGIYRTDAWLMDHFLQPARKIPRSLMPVFPFDPTKFAALTHFLDAMGQRNQTRAKEQLDRKGFSPKEAFLTHCAQCHGQERLGNGPVAEWIYPPPKNLRNPDFLANLTKERAILSITRGVAGTPMAPWGTSAKEGGEPVFTAGEIQLLVDWLFEGLPAGVLAQKPLKWQYGREEAEREWKESTPLFIRDQPPYSIQKSFYTQENIEAGRAFFLQNCASCHGSQADGAGLRAEAMQDAKPRMLTNREWLASQDDLDLLRSIKYGVPGTAMTPWGDQTNPLQRMQLVVFIRSLTEPSKKGPP